MSLFHTFRFLSPVLLPIAENSPGVPGKLIAVAALSLDECSEISVHASHAPNFLLFDDGGHLKEIIPNPYMSIHDEIAPKVADLLEKHHVRLMIACDIGSHLADALEAKGIEHITDMGLANIAVTAHRK